MQTRIDHLVIGAADLPQGIDYVKECLGVDMHCGGVHEKMGTHNHLLQSVLESIGAVDYVKIHPLQKNRSPSLVAHIHTSRGTKELRSDVGMFSEALQRTNR
jgi:hypothetical protein